MTELSPKIIAIQFFKNCQGLTGYLFLDMLSDDRCMVQIRYKESFILRPKKNVESFLQAGPLLMDGAYGTQLYQRGIFINKCFEEANVSRPELVTQLHRDYFDAGAKAITTNSWGASFFKLKEHNHQDRLREINQAAARLARGVAGEEALVLGSVGPLGVRFEPFGPVTRDRASQAFSEHAEALVS